MPFNYRPIFLTCRCGKRIDNIILKSQSAFVQNLNILFPRRHGLRRGISTITQLLETIHDYTSYITERSQTNVVLSGFSKTFVGAPHTNLVKKFKIILGESKVVDCGSGFLSDRHHFVYYERQLSPKVMVTSGVSEGSVLPPLLFPFFINDFTHNLDINVQLFYDDCILYRAIKNDSDLITVNNVIE